MRRDYRQACTFIACNLPQYDDQTHGAVEVDDIERLLDLTKRKNMVGHTFLCVPLGQARMPILRMIFFVKLRRTKNVLVKINKRNMSIAVAAMLGMVLLLQSGCVKQYSNQPVPNKTPLTFFWIYSDTAVAQGVSKQELRWWGEDQDGYVVGYLLAIVPNLSAIPNPDTLTYS